MYKSVYSDGAPAQHGAAAMQNSVPNVGRGLPTIITPGQWRALHSSNFGAKRETCQAEMTDRAFAEVDYIYFRSRKDGLAKNIKELNNEDFNHILINVNIRKRSAVIICDEARLCWPAPCLCVCEARSQKV